ncbi:MAG: hypothetical protein HQL80_00485 [Magnetococcales bacterium]|nr:hypothetical protein [Magnetococcales bacterium]
MISTAKIISQRKRQSARTVPGWVVVLLLVAGGMQLAWGSSRPPPTARATALAAPPPSALLRLAALGDSIAFARALMLWVQNFDNQPGLAIPFRTLDYEALAQWLRQVLALDPRSEYPLYAALSFYAPIADKSRSLRMLAFIHASFRENPALRWRWLALAAVEARHRWGEKGLALSYLNEIYDQAAQGHLPQWVRGMQLSLLRQEEGLQSARQIVGGLLYNGVITDPGELKYLQAWLERWEAEAAK